MPNTLKSIYLRHFSANKHLTQCEFFFCCFCIFLNPGHPLRHRRRIHIEHRHSMHTHTYRTHNIYMAQNSMHVQRIDIQTAHTHTHIHTDHTDTQKHIHTQHTYRVLCVCLRCALCSVLCVQCVCVLYVAMCCA